MPVLLKAGHNELVFFTIARWVKPLLASHEDLGLNPQSPDESCDTDNPRAPVSRWRGEDIKCLHDA